MNEQRPELSPEYLKRLTQMAAFRSLWVQTPSERLYGDAMNSVGGGLPKALFGLGFGLDDDDPEEQLWGWTVKQREVCDDRLKSVNLLPLVKAWLGEIIWVAGYTNRQPEQILPLISQIDESTFRPDADLEPLEGYILHDLAAKVKIDPGIDDKNNDPVMHEARAYLAEMTQEFTEKYGFEKTMQYRVVEDQ